MRAHTSPREEIVGADEAIVFGVAKIPGFVCDCDHLSILGMLEREGDSVSVIQPRGDGTEWTTGLEVPANEFITSIQRQTAAIWGETKQLFGIAEV